MMVQNGLILKLMRQSDRILLKFKPKAIIMIMIRLGIQVNHGLRLCHLVALEGQVG